MKTAMTPTQIAIRNLRADNFGLESITILFQFNTEVNILSISKSDSLFFGVSGSVRDYQSAVNITDDRFLNK
jgi:hypothetical protein